MFGWTYPRPSDGQGVARMMDRLTTEHGLKVFMSVVGVLLAIMGSLVAYVWADTTGDVDNLKSWKDRHEAKREDLEKRFSRIEAHYEHIEISMQDIKSNQAYFRDRVDTIIEKLDD